MSDSSGTGQITQQMEKLDMNDATAQHATVASRHEKPALPAWNLDSNSFVPGSSRALSPVPQSDQALPLEKNTKPQSPGLPSQPPPPPQHPMFYGASPFYGSQYVQPHPDEFSVNRPVSPGLTAMPRGPYKTPLVNNVDIRKRDQKSPIKGMHHGYTHYYQQNNKQRPPPQPYANNYYGSSRSRTHPQIQTQHHTQTGQQPGHFTYAPSALPHNVHISPGRRSVHSFFMSESLRQDLHHRTSLILKGSDPDDPATKSLPERVGGYHSFYPLEDSSSISRTFSGLPTFVYKCMNIRDGLPYIMRKVDSTSLRTNEYGMQIVEMWKQIQHPGVVTLRELFRSTLFDPGHTVSSLFFVYDYHPGAQTLEEKFFNTSTLSYFQEEVIWSFIVQLCSAIECIHSHSQACRQTLTPSKILVTGKNRLRINCVGIEDVLQLEPNRNVPQLQYLDMHYLGQLIVSLACKSTDAMSNFAKSMEHISNTYSQDLKDLIVTLCNNKRNAAYPTISDICQVINSRILDQVDRLYCYNDILEGELAKEVENGRLFRLVCKLGFVNERPETNVSAAWSETGDRYLAKLFRDYVFHQVQEDGTPVIDFAHVVECLNKLDVGTDEKLLLMSRDEKSMLVASYKDLKRILTDCFNQLVAKQAQSELAKQQGTLSPGGFGLPSYSSPQPTVTPQQKQLQHQQLQLQLQLHQHQLQQHYLSEPHHDFG